MNNNEIFNYLIKFDNKIYTKFSINYKYPRLIKKTFIKKFNIDTYLNIINNYNDKLDKNNIIYNRIIDIYNLLIKNDYEVLKVILKNIKYKKSIKNYIKDFNNKINIFIEKKHNKEKEYELINIILLIISIILLVSIVLLFCINMLNKFDNILLNKILFILVIIFILYLLICDTYDIFINKKRGR